MIPGSFLLATFAAFAVLAALYVGVGAILRKLLPPTHPLRGKLGTAGLLKGAARTVKYLQWLVVAVIVIGGLMVTLLHS